MLFSLEYVSDADASGTVFFNAPLYRPNLLYKVVPKSAKGKELVEDMAKYVLEFHKGESGIVYCLSKKVRFLPILFFAFLTSRVGAR